MGKVPRAIDHGTNERSQLSSVIVARDFCRISAIVDIPMPKDVLRYEEGKEKLRIFSRAIQRARLWRRGSHTSAGQPVTLLAVEERQQPLIRLVLILGPIVTY